MKKIIILTLFILLSAASAQAQYTLRITLKDGMPIDIPIGAD